MAMALPKETEKYYTYKDYLTWGDDTRYELIDGVPYAMAGASRVHQEIVGGIFSQLYSFLKGKQCKVFIAPFDVRLNPGSYDDTVVQPDILVVCDRSKIGSKSCNGAPDMVIEILSPSNAQYDLLVKYQKYLNAGVREYWIVDPERKTVQVFILENKKYIANVYGDTDTAHVHVLDGCRINLADVFSQISEIEGEVFNE